MNAMPSTDNEDPAQTDQGHRCPLTESMNIVKNIDNQKCPDQTVRLYRLICLGHRLWFKIEYFNKIRTYTLSWLNENGK